MTDLFTMRHGLPPKLSEIESHPDSSHNDTDDGRSTLGQAILLFLMLVAWRSKVSTGSAHSAMESEIYAGDMTIRESRWMKYVAKFVLRYHLKPITVYCDNNPMIQSCMSPRVTDQNKHIKPKYFYMAQLAQRQKVILKKVPTEDQVADIFTKALGNPQFARLRSLLGVE